MVVVQDASSSAVMSAADALRALALRVLFEGKVSCAGAWCFRALYRDDGARVVCAFGDVWRLLVEDRPCCLAWVPFPSRCALGRG